MAKRGSTRPWRIRYEWDNGVKGTETRASLSEAQDLMRQMERNATWADARVTVTIQRRDHAEPVAVVTYDAGET